MLRQHSRCLLKSSRAPFLTARCRRACLARWSLRMKRLWHMGQANLFSPVWVRRWRDSSSERANCRSQPSHLHLKGFSPVARQFNFLLASASASSALILSILLLYLTCVCPHVGLEVGTLEVGLAAVLVGTNVTAYARHFWLQRAQSLLQCSGTRCGGDGRQLGAAARDQRGLDVQCGYNWL